jgi:metallo-beta-lactamase class B
MKFFAATLTATAAGVLALGLTTNAQGPALPPDVQKHIDAARAAGGTQYSDLAEMVCGRVPDLVNPRPDPPAAGGGGQAQAPPRATWYAEPVKVFDNLYFVGQTEYSAWAITTTQGIILLDAIFDYSVADEVEGGLMKLGLNPADLKYVVLSHGHRDHAAGAKYLQDKYKARVLMSAADYDLVEQQQQPWRPRRDMVITDGQKLTLGDTTLTFYLTPGHTEGTVSTIFPVRDGRNQHVAAAWGGTLFNFATNNGTQERINFLRKRIAMYRTSAERFRAIVTKANADVVLSNHTRYDGSKTKLPAVTARKAGELHPYVVGNASVRRYLDVVNECAQAAEAGLK